MVIGATFDPIEVTPSSSLQKLRPMGRVPVTGAKHKRPKHAPLFLLAVWGLSTVCRRDVLPVQHPPPAGIRSLNSLGISAKLPRTLSSGVPEH